MKLKLMLGVFWILILVAGVSHVSVFAQNPAPSPMVMSPSVQAVQPVPQDVTLGQLLKAGGWTMFVLGLLSVAALALIIYNFSSLKIDQLAPQRFTEELIAKLEAGEIEMARSMCTRNTNIISSIAQAGLSRGTKGKLIAREAMENVARKEIGKLWQNIAYLGDIATIAPLLGLLGTTIGMIQAFNVISFAGASLKPIMLVGGISKALVTTAAGLIIAVPALSLHSYFRGKVQDISDQVEANSTDLMTLIEAQATSKNR